jgi:hypothetical protein
MESSRVSYMACSAAALFDHGEKLFKWRNDVHATLTRNSILPAILRRCVLSH